MIYKKKITWIYNYVPPFNDPYGDALFTPILVETAMITTGSWDEANKMY